MSRKWLVLRYIYHGCEGALKVMTIRYAPNIELSIDYWGFVVNSILWTVKHLIKLQEAIYSLFLRNQILKSLEIWRNVKRLREGAA